MAFGHSVAMTCTESTPNTTFNWYRGTSPGGESATPLNATPTTACAYTDSSVIGLQTYYYIAKAYCSTCSPSLSGPSNEISATIPGDPQPAPPVLANPTVSQGKVPLQWTEPQKVDAFNVYRGGSLDMKNPQKIATTTATNYTDSPSKGQHFYDIKATLSGKLSNPSNVVKVVVK